MTLFFTVYFKIPHLSIANRIRIINLLMDSYPSLTNEI